MQQPRNAVPQEVPTKFADQLRRMRDTADPRLNAVLAAARSRGWRTATLADVLRMNPTACSKRIERADFPTPDAVARRNLDVAIAKMAASGRADLASYMKQVAEGPDVHANLAGVAEKLAQLDPETRPVRTARRAVQRAMAYTQPARPDISEVEIPEPPPRPAAMMDGKKLKDEEIAELRRLKEMAAQVNGATPSEIEPGVKHPLRQASEDYSARLNHLIAKRGFTPYYLARELDVTHRAITSRLERHGYRTPCPSVQGTPSGTYRGRKIGERSE